MPSSKKPSAGSAPSGFGWENPLIPHPRLQQIYVALLEARLLNAAIKRSRLPLRKTILTGHEACIAASALQLTSADWIAPATGDAIARSLHHQPLADVLRIFGAPSSIAPANIIAPAGLAYQDWAVANGVALAANVAASAERSVVLAYSGPRSHLSMACLNPLGYAAKHNLPIVFVSFAGLNGPIIAPELPAFAQASGVPAFPVDGNDPVAVYRVAQESILRARTGGGPSFIDCRTFIDGSKKPQDPLRFMEKYLDRKGLFSPAWKASLERNYTRTLDKAMLTACKPASTKRKR